MARGRRDPVAKADDGSQDLYEVADWEVRSALDWVAHWLYYGALALARGLVVLAAVAIFASQFLLGGLGAVADPILGAFTLLSAVPALVLAGYVWRADVTTREPLSLLVATFLLGVLFAGFAGILNVYVGDPVEAVASGFGLVPALGTLVGFYVVVGPVEETIKLLAVRLFAYRSDRFDAVVDGAVYGAVAGLGFATIENALYITRAAGETVAATGAVESVGGVAVLRTLTGPGHVLYSAFAGYYLGLAKFNREHAGPIVLKGLLIAAFVHASYNALVGIVPAATSALYDVDPLVAFVGFVVVYDGAFGYLLVRKIAAYETAYRRAHDAAGSAPAPQSERTEFES